MNLGWDVKHVHKWGPELIHGQTLRADKRWCRDAFVDPSRQLLVSGAHNFWMQGLRFGVLTCVLSAKSIMSLSESFAQLTVTKSPDVQVTSATRSPTRCTSERIWGQGRNDQGSTNFLSDSRPSVHDSRFRGQQTSCRIPVLRFTIHGSGCRA